MEKDSLFSKGLGKINNQHSHANITNSTKPNYLTLNLGMPPSNGGFSFSYVYANIHEYTGQYKI